MFMALVLGLVSCQNEPDEMNVLLGGEEQIVTVNVAVQETETRAVELGSDKGVFNTTILEEANTTMRYILQVYYKNGENFVKSDERKVEYSDGRSVAFDVRLVPGRDYQFVVWADVVVNGEQDTDNHYNTSDLKEIKLNNTWVAMDESRDAFTATEFIDNFNSSKNINITLKRPFAKLRVVTTDMTALNNLGIEPKTATVTYTEPHYGAFNAFAGKAIGDSKNRNIKHENFAIASYGETGDNKTLFTDYFFAEDDATNFILEVFDQDNKIIKSGEFTTDIYVKRNNLTTIKGNILTDGNSFDVTIEDGFAGESGKDDGKTFANVDTAEELLDAINKGVENITLDGNIDLGSLTTRAAASDVLTVAAGKNITLDLNGKTISYTKACESSYAMIANNGRLTINDSVGGGKISFKDTGAGDPTFGWGSYTIQNNNTLVVNGGTIEHLGEQNATEVKHMICAIFQYSGSTTINNGTISTPTYRSARLWHGDMTINGGNFEGQLWVHAVDNDANLTINGGTFAPRGVDGSSIFITNSEYEVNAAVTGGFFNTKIGCSDASKAGVKGCIVGGTFTAAAIDKTNPALIAHGYKVIEEDGKYNVVLGTVDDVASSTETLKDAIEAGNDTIALTSGTYNATSITNIAGKTISFVGNGEDTVFDYSSQGYNSYVSGGNGNFTFENMTITRSTETFAGMAHTNSTVYKNCVINGVYFVYEKNAQFIDCTFNVTGNYYNCWLYGTSKATYTNCTFNCDGKSIYVDGNGDAGSDAEFNNCVFNDINKVVTDKAAIETGTTYGKRYKLIINNATVNGFNINPNGIVTDTTLWANKHSMTSDKLEVIIDGCTWVADGVTLDENGNYLISKASGLTWFSDQINNKKNTFAGKTIKVVNDIDMAGATYYGGSVASYPSYCFKGTFDGGEKVISNLTITVENDVHGAAALIPTLAGDGTTIKNVTLKNVNISSSHYAGGIWGYTTNDNCYINVTNCHVEGGTITGNIYNGDNADKVGGIGGIFYTGVVSNCSVKGVTISGYRDIAGLVGWAADINATIKNNEIENVTINVNNTTNYKKYTNRAQYDVNSYVGEGVGTAKIEGNTGEATINWGSIAE